MGGGEVSGATDQLIEASNIPDDGDEGDAPETPAAMEERIADFLFRSKPEECPAAPPCVVLSHRNHTLSLPLTLVERLCEEGDEGEGGVKVAVMGVDRVWTLQADQQSDSDQSVGLRW